MKAYQAFVSRINGATLRERVLLFAAFGTVLWALWYQLLMAPLVAREQVMALTLDDIRNQAASNPSGDGIDGAAREYASLRARETALSRAIALTDADLTEAQAGMIAPRDMMAALTEGLHRQKDISLVLLRNLPVEPLVAGGERPAANGDRSAANGDRSAAGGERPAAGGDRIMAAGREGAPPASFAGPYLHPVELVLRGSYLGVLAYLQALEAKPAGFQWRRFELSSTATGLEYRIEFTTVSMESNWLGV